MTPRATYGAVGWQAALGLFALCQGLKLVLVRNLFAQYRSYEYLARQPLTQRGWAAVLFAYGIASLLVAPRGRARSGAMTLCLGAALWLYLGTEMLIGSILNDVWTSDGVFEMLIGFGCVAAVTHWSRSR